MFNEYAMELQWQCVYFIHTRYDLICSSLQLHYLPMRFELQEKIIYELPAYVAGIICLLAPVIMGAQEWDDHDRSNKLLAPDIAKDYLNSCPQNAMLFTFGDNDTYPLWYAQEVEGVRPDIRIINTSLLGIDWYVNQLRYKSK